MATDNKLWWLEGRKWAQTIQKGTEKAMEAAETLFHAREGSSVEKGLAWLSLLGLAAETLIPPSYAENRLKAAGWRKVASSSLATTALWELLHLNYPHEDVYLDSAQKAEDQTYWASKAMVWRDEEGDPNIIILTFYSDHSLWEREEGTITQLVQNLFWTTHGTAVDVHGLENNRDSSDPKVSYTPLRTSGDYEGDNQTLQKVRDSFTQPYTGTARVVLLVGPTGVGKTTLSCTALGPETRVVKLPKPTNLRLHPTLELLRILQPQVILLDDIPMPSAEEKMSQDLASLLDALHDIAKLVVCTFMDDAMVSEEQLTPGVFYYPGMRSGRVDEVIFLPPPNREGRTTILTHYGVPPSQAKLVAKLTKGLTGAYLKEVASRINQRGQSPEEAVRVIRLQAPEAMSRKNSNASPETPSSPTPGNQ